MIAHAAAPSVELFDGALFDVSSGARIEDPAVLIRPYAGISAGYGELPAMRKRHEMLRAVDPDGFYVLVPLAMGRPGGLSPEQATALINLLTDPDADAAVAEFHEHLCLDDDIRPWIDQATRSR